MSLRTAPPAHAGGRGDRASARAASVAAACLLALLGCAADGGAAPQEVFYRLSATPGGAADAQGSAPPVFDGAMVVNRFAADGLVSQRPLVYAEGESPHEMHQYNYRLWADPPPRMLQELTVNVLRAARVADPVVTPDTRLAPDYELSGKITRLEHLRGEAPAVVIGLEFGVYRVLDGDLIWLEQYEAERRAADETVTEATRAMNEALTEIFATFVRDLASR